MKRTGLLLCTVFLLFSLSACSDSEHGGQQNTHSPDNKPSITSTSAENDKASQSEKDTQTENTAQPEEAPQTQGPQEAENEKENSNMLTIRIGDRTLTADLENNSSAEALKELLSKGSLTLNMSDYGGMEKTAALPEKLPQNNESINTDAGDLILYQGNVITIYYDTNSWSLTRLGKINNITKSELQEILGNGDVSVTFSLASE